MDSTLITIPDSKKRTLLDLTPGQRDYISGYIVKELILKSSDFIVYLDDKNNLIWSTEGYEDFPKDFGIVTSKVTMLEHLAEKIFWKKDTTKFKYLIGEGMARVLDDRSTERAMLMLNDVEARLKAEAKHILKTYYIVGSIVTTCLAIFTFLFFWINSSYITYAFSWKAQTVILAALCGGIGAFVSSFFRSVNFEGDITIPNWVYSLDGFLRIFYGIVAGLIITLAIKSNLILGVVNDQTSATIELLFFFGLIAGASESLIPSLIKKIENKIDV